MINRVKCELEAFQTKRLECISTELGKMIGNIERPTVDIIPTIPNEEPPKDRNSDLNFKPRSARSGPAKPKAGPAHIQGYFAKLASHAPAAGITTA